ncbi:MAG: GDSL-type esterase/lipase family protein [Lachnospiraceae bacterium]|nr:GDSL-type esterase/lipase family protein [Lachnospiraceae bacterium]
MFYRKYVFGTAEAPDEFYSSETAEAPDEFYSSETAEAPDEFYLSGRAEAPDECGSSGSGLNEQNEDTGEIVHVSAHNLYQPGKGYGFVTEENRREQELLKLPELNSGFDTVYWYQDEVLSHIEEDEWGCYLDSDGIMADLEHRGNLNSDEKAADTTKNSEAENMDERGPAGESLAGESSTEKALEEVRSSEAEHRRIPLIFKLHVPQQGNYRVTIKIRMPRLRNTICRDTEFSNADLMIFTGRRRLGFLMKHFGSTEEILQSDCFVHSGEAFYANDSESQVEISGAGSINVLPTESLNESSNGSSREHSKDPWTELTCTMTVNVCDFIPRGRTAAYSDTTLDITILADRPRISELTVEKVDCATIYIAGDSTVTDQSADYPYAPGTSYAGWGQMLPAYLTDDVAVSNHAHSGLTTESFREEGHYAIVEKYIRKGDYCLFQFAHNDQKLDHLKAQGGYRQNLERYIRECREKGAYPILVTPLARNTWKGSDGSYNDLLAEYAGVCKEIGSELQVPVLDLHARSMEWIMQNGREAVRTSFFPDDYTHTNDYGAYRMAGYVADELAHVCGDNSDGKQQAQVCRDDQNAQPQAQVCRDDQNAQPQAQVCRDNQNAQPQAYACEDRFGARPRTPAHGDRPDDRSQAHICGGNSACQALAACVTDGFGEWNPPAHIALPVKPAAYEHVANPEADAQLLADISDPDQPASRVDVLDMVIKTVRFFYTNVYNDMFADVIGHEWYAGAVECAYQNGIIDGHLVENGCFYPEKEVTLEEFLSFAINGYRSRKELPPQKPCAYEKTCAPWAVPYVRAACELGLLKKDGSDDLYQIFTRGKAAELCRRMHI